MSETNDNLQQVAAEATTTNTQQAAGAEDSVSTAQGSASTETTETLEQKLARLEEENGKYRKEIENKNKLIGRKAVDVETLRALGLAPEAKQEAAQTAESPQTKVEGQQVAQQAGGDGLEQWFKNAEKAYGQTRALTMLAQYIAQQTAQATLAQTLQPVNEGLARDRETRNQERLAAAVDKLALEYPDIHENVDAMGTYLKANPRIQKEITSADTIKEKQELLELVYLKVQKQKGTTATAAAKTAGALDAQQRERMKATSVTAGAGAGAKATQGDMTPEEAYKEAMRASMRKNSTLL